MYYILFNNFFGLRFLDRGWNFQGVGWIGVEQLESHRGLSSIGQCRMFLASDFNCIDWELRSWEVFCVISSAAHLNNYHSIFFHVLGDKADAYKKVIEERKVMTIMITTFLGIVIMIQLFIISVCTVYNKRQNEMQSTNIEAKK